MVNEQPGQSWVPPTAPDTAPPPPSAPPSFASAPPAAPPGYAAPGAVPPGAAPPGYAAPGAAPPGYEAGPPPGYGPPPPGAYAQPYSAPPPADPGESARGRRALVIVASVLGGLAVLGTVVTLLAVFVVVPKMRESSPDWLTENAVARLERSAALRYRGSFVDDAGRAVELDATVGADRMAGSLRVDGNRTEFVSSESMTYLKGTAGFWNTTDPVVAGAYADRWVQLDGNPLRLALSSFLPPAKIAESVGELTLSGENKLKIAGKRTVGGVRAAKIPVKEGGAIYVGLAKPYRLVRLEGPAVTGTFDSRSTNRDFRFDVDEVSKSGLAAATKDLTKVAASAVDPDKPATLPAAYVVEELVDRPQDECGMVSCTIQVKVKNIYGPARPGAKHLLIAMVWDGRGDTGKILSRCETVLKPMPIDKVTPVTCVASDPRWARWVRNSSSEWYSFNAVTFNPGWDGATSATLVDLIERQTDVEYMSIAVEQGGGLGLQTLSRLLKYPGMKAADAAEIVRRAADVDQLDVVYAYVASGRAANPAALKAFLGDVQTDTADLAATRKHAETLRTAVERTKTGSGPVKLGG